jgi:murein DD-endopeptidase MepM/ murein hydrolase activator NlpD
LLSIANLYDVTIDELATINNLANPDAIYVGQTLLVGGTVLDIADQSTGETTVVTHVVQPGETLFRIATQYGTTMNVIQDANAISDPELLFVGQELIIPDVEIPELALDLPDVVTQLDLMPRVLIEGQSGRVRVVTNAPATLSGQFLDRELIVISEPNNTIHTIFVPIPLYTPTGVYTMQLTVYPSAGTAVNVVLNIQIVSGAYGSVSVILPDDKIPLISPAVEDNEFNLLQSVTSQFNPERYFDGPLSLPATAVMNAPFGSRRSYNGGLFDHFHSGADFAGAPGSPVMASAPGKVVLADTLNIRGVSVMIDHGWGIYTGYSHMSERYVQLGDFVSTGQIIGIVGTTGRATGAHLHWELWVNGVVVDPMQWVRQSFP